MSMRSRWLSDHAVLFWLPQNQSETDEPCTQQKQGTWLWNWDVFDVREIQNCRCAISLDIPEIICARPDQEIRRYFICRGRTVD